VDTESSPGRCGGVVSPGAAPRSTEVPYGGGGYVPVGAPFSEPVMSPVSAPAPSSGADSNQPVPPSGADSNQPMPPSGADSNQPVSPSGDNSTMAHTTMVSAMQVGLVHGFFLDFVIQF